MTLRETLGVIREQWVVMTLAVVLALGAATAVWALRPPAYTATLELYVSAQTTDNTQTAYQGGLLSQQRVKSYVELVGSTRVSEEVLHQLRLPGTPEELAGRISASSSLDSVLIHVAVTGGSPAQVADIANSVGRVVVDLVDELEKPSKPNADPPVRVRIVRPASVPTAPSTPGLPVMLAIGLLAGLVAGTGAALGRNLLDTSVKSPEQLREVATAPNLGVISFDPAVRKRPLTLQEEPQSARAEAFRQLRTNLQFLDVDNRHKVVAISSPLPADGKTTTTLNLAVALASGGQKVLVVEADLRRPTGAAVLGLEGAVGLTSVLSGKVRIEQAIQSWGAGIDVLASGPLPPNPSELLASNHMKLVLRDVRAWYDMVLIDTPPLLPVTDAAAVAPATDGVLLVARHHRSTRDQVRRAVEALQAVGAPVLGTVLTMAPASGPRAYAHYGAAPVVRPAPADVFRTRAGATRQLRAVRHGQSGGLHAERKVPVSRSGS